MKYMLVFVLGVVCGLGAAAAALYYNPLTVESPPALQPNTILRYDLMSRALLASTHGNKLKLGFKPEGIGQLWEATISKAALNVLVLTDNEDAPVAIASRLSKLSEQTNLVSMGVVLADHWLVTVPGRGSYFVEVDNNIWPLVRDTLVDVDLLRRPWSGPRLYHATIGPQANGVASVVGATGAYLGAYGSGEDALELADYAGRLDFTGHLRGELRLRIFESDDADSGDTTADTAH